MLTRLAKEGDLTASGVAYAVIMLPGFELATVQIFKITRTQESALLLYFLTTAGHASLSISLYILLSVGMLNVRGRILLELIVTFFQLSW